MKTFMFPGQGSQAKGMGGRLFDEFPEWTRKADDILGYSIKQLCLEDPRNELHQTQFTQPALFVVNALSYFKRIESPDQIPDFVAGHSLGEFNALLAAECFDFEVGLKLVKKRGELMSQAPDGNMAAILNSTKERIETILKDNGLTELDVANYNTPSQIVISGSKEDIAKASNLFQDGQVSYIPLNTSGAFHSRLMQAPKEEFEKYLMQFEFSDFKIPVISNVSARPYIYETVFDSLANQMTSAVRWSESIEYLMAQGEMIFEEIGHGNVLTKLIDKIWLGPPTWLDDIKFLSAVEKVSAWNKRYKIGTRVKSTLVDEDNLQTRTEAMVLFGRRAVVYMNNLNGYFDLNEVIPLENS